MARPLAKPTWSTPVAKYFFAVGVVGAFYLLGIALEPVLGGRGSFLIFVLPVFFVVLVLGRGPGLAAGGLSLIAALNIAFKAGEPALPTFAQGSIFLLVCAGLGWLESAMRTQRAMAGTATSQLDLLLESAIGYAVLTVDNGGYITTWSGGAKDLLGWSGDEVIGQHCAMFLSGPETHREAMARLEEARTAGRFSGETWQVRADGSEFLAEVTVAPLPDHARGGGGFAKIIHDVTGHRAEQRALQRREELLRSILATVPDAMVVIDHRGAILSFSNAAERLFGCSEAEVTGQNVSMLMPSPDREMHDNYLARYLESGVPRIIGIGRIVTGRRADGTTFPMALSVGEAKSSEERLFTGFIQDLTERRDFEARLEQLQSELIHVARLSAMGTLASTLAHELNQPLTAIANYGEAASAMLEGEDPPDKDMLREVVGEIAGQSLRAGGIVRRLRQFVAKGDLPKSVEDLPKIIEEASALALVGVRERGVETYFNYAPDASPVLIDRVQIQQVMLNLIRNALEAMNDTPRKQLSVSTTLLDRNTVEVIVADTGPGIEPHVREKLFEAFNSTKDDGMGLGLSICRTIVEAHGGRIKAVDRADGGTEFRFTLMHAEGAAR
ncbi:PAS domain-containing sensor histidine kinase [Tsuneonella sp. HG249]